MPVSSFLSTRLMPYVGDAARDVLFTASEQFPQRCPAPSTDLVIARWSTMNAVSAVNLASTVTDPVLLDFIASKDKRKTVRCAVAGNKNTHPVTRMYFFQEGLQSNHDILEEAIGAMSSDELLEYWEGDEQLTRRLRRQITTALLEATDRDRVIRVLLSLDADDYILSGLLSRNPDKALELFDAAGIELSKIGLREWPQAHEITIETVKRLIDVYAPNRRGRVVEDLLDSRRVNHQLINEIDPALYDVYLENVRHLDDEDIDAVVAAGRGQGLFEAVKRGVRVSESGLVKLTGLVEDDSARVALAFACRDSKLAASLVTNVALFAAEASQRKPREYMDFVLQLAEELPSDVVVELLAAASTDCFGSNEVDRICHRTGLHPNDLIERLPHEFAAALSGDVHGLDQRRMLDWATAIGGDVARRAAANVLHRSYGGDALGADGLRILLDDNIDHAGAAQSVLDADESVVAALVAQDESYLAKLVHVWTNYGSSPTRVSWLGQIINHLEPREGWMKILTAERIAIPAVALLQQRIGEDTRTWEVVFNLLPDWTGTLDQLVDSAYAL